MRPLSAHERRLIAVGLAVACVALVVCGIGVPILAGIKARAAERETLRLSYIRDSRLLATLPAWRADLARQKRTAILYKLPAANRSEAEGQLTRTVNAALAQESVTPGAITTLPTTGAGVVGVRAEATLTYRQVVDLVRRLENQEPRIAVDYLAITTADAAKTARSGALDMRLELSAAFTEAVRDKR